MKDQNIMRETQYLAICAISPNGMNLLAELSRLAMQHNCHVQQSHIHRQGQHYLVHMVMRAHWSAIAKTENTLAALPARFPGTQLGMQRMQYEEAHTSAPAFVYMLYISAPEDPQQLYRIVQFMQQENTTIQELFIDSYKTRLTQMPMLSMTLRILLPAETIISEWRERLMVYCDDLNIDAVMEPEKN